MPEANNLVLGKVETNILLEIGFTPPFYTISENDRQNLRYMVCSCVNIIPSICSLLKVNGGY